VYHLTIHAQLEKTPQGAWHESILKRKQPARLVSNSEEFFLDFLPAVSRLVQKDGIHFYKIRYWANVLSPWAGRLKEPLLVKYDPRNISRLYVRDPHGKHWPIPYSDLGQPPVALWELLEARNGLREQGARVESELAIFHSILEQRRIVSTAVSISRQRRRQERAGTMLAPKTPSKQPQKHLIFDVTPYRVEEWKE
jgi:putative transposase